MWMSGLYSKEVRPKEKLQPISTGASLYHKPLPIGLCSGVIMPVLDYMPLAGSFFPLRQE